MSASAHAVIARKLQKECSECTEADISKSDIVAANSRSISSILFRASLADPFNRMTRYEFTAWTRCWRALPQPERLGNARYAKELGYNAEQCLQPHLKDPNQWMDVHGNHANSGCPSAAAGRGRRHSLLKWALYYKAKEAGCIVRPEPPTKNLLLGQFSAKQCRSLFPKNPTKQMKKEIDDLHSRLEDIKKMKSGKEREKQEFTLEKMCDLMHDQYNTKGLRIDLQIEDPVSNQEIWVDVTCIHPTCKSRIKTELKQIKEEIQANEDERRGMNNFGREKKYEGYAARAQTQLKHRVYGPLITIARKQLYDGRR